MKSAFSKSPILVIDREGLIGESLCLKLSQEFLIVFAGRGGEVPFSGKFPTIPDNKYSHIIFIDEKGQDLEILPKIIKKVKDINANFIFVQGMSLAEEYAADKIMRVCPGAEIAIFGDVFDNKLILGREGYKSVINKFIYQAQRFGKIQVMGDGLRGAYPVFLPDVVDGLIDLVFGIQKKHSLFYIFPKHPVSELALAHMIQKINPEITIDFIRHDPRPKNIFYPPNGEYLLSDKYPLAQKIRSIDIKKNPSAGGRAQRNNLEEDTKKIKNVPLFIIWIMIFLLFSPIIFTVLFSFLGLNILYNAKSEMDKGNFVNAKSSLHLSQTFFYLGKQTSNILFFQAKVIGGEDNIRKYSQSLDSGLKISGNLLQIFDSGTYFSKILTGKSENPSDDFAKAENYLKNSMVALNKIKLEEKIPASISQNLEIINPLIKLLSATTDILPGILGMETPKTYLILFQDNLELRPGGGLINSYGILKLNQGKIMEFDIYNVDDADQQLRGHVEPPFAIRRYLSKQHWYMKDGNFDVDFAQSALSVANFLLAETGQQVSGVVAVDNTFVKNILQAIGPVYVANYKENVDENNFYKLMQSHTQNKDFPRSLYKSIVAKPIVAKTAYLLIAQAISNALTQKHLLFEFKDVQNIFTVNGWSSSLWDERKESGDSVNDFVGINEANLGLNRVNGFIKRQVTQTVKIEPDGSLFGELSLSYKNDAAFEPNGNYKNYLRIILPIDTLLNSLSVNDVSQVIVDAIVAPQIYEAKNFKAPKDLEIEKTIETQKAIYGFLVNVPAGELVRIKIQYTVLRKNVFDPNNFSYNLKIFKQPGIDILPYSFSLYYPDSLSVINSGGLKKEDSSLSYSEKITGDKNLIINFAKK